MHPQPFHDMFAFLVLSGRKSLKEEFLDTSLKMRKV